MIWLRPPRPGDSMVGLGERGQVLISYKNLEEFHAKTLTRFLSALDNPAHLCLDSRITD